jgi:hypothetical protein
MENLLFVMWYRLKHCGVAMQYVIPQNTPIHVKFEPLAKRLSSRKSSIRDPYLQTFRNWIPAKSLPE